jgi:hypothetical protein
MKARMRAPDLYSIYQESLILAPFAVRAASNDRP